MKKIKVSDKVLKTFKIKDEDIRLFAKASGDTNPLHLDEKYAENSIFGKRVAHGMLAASYISSILGTLLPGEGSIYLKQLLEFKKPIYINEVIDVIVEIIDIKKTIVTLSTVCVKENGDIAVEGKAAIKVPREMIYDL